MSPRDLADESLNRSFATIQNTPGEGARVRIAVRSCEAVRLAGVGAVVDLLHVEGGPEITVRGKSDGDTVGSGEVMMLIEGPLGRLIALETECMGLLSCSAAATRMSALVEAAGNVPVIDMSARRCPPELQPRLAVAAAVGGAAGTITRTGHAEVHARFGLGGEQIRIGSGTAHEFKLYGTVSESLNTTHGDSTIESAAAYHERFPKVPLIVPIGSQGGERDLISAAVQRFHMDLYGVRLEVSGKRIHQGGHDKPVRALEMRILSRCANRAAAMEALGRYGFGPGLTVEAVYAVRDLLDSLNSKQTKIFVSADFDADKVRAFRYCGAPMDFIGTWEWVGFSRFASEVVGICTDGEWKACRRSARDTDDAALLEFPVLHLGRIQV